MCLLERAYESQAGVEGPRVFNNGFVKVPLANKMNRELEEGWAKRARIRTKKKRSK